MQVLNFRMAIYLLIRDLLLQQIDLTFLIGKLLVLRIQLLTKNESGNSMRIDEIEGIVSLCSQLGNYLLVVDVSRS